MHGGSLVGFSAGGVGLKQLALRRLRGKKFLAELFEPLVGALITRLGMIDMFAEDDEIVAKLGEISLKLS